MDLLTHGNGNDTARRIGNNDSITAGIKDFFWGGNIPGFAVLAVSRDNKVVLL